MATKTDDQSLLTFTELTQVERARELVAAIQRLSLARALELGTDAFVLKPWEEDELLELAERLIADRRGADG